MVPTPNEERARKTKLKSDVRDHVQRALRGHRGRCLDDDYDRKRVVDAVTGMLTRYFWSVLQGEEKE